MNIFFLDRDPRKAAQALCDKHVPKMLLESVQILCTVSFLRGKPAPYRATHVNHPCVKWVNTSFLNWKWLKDHAIEIADEYERRFGKRHKSRDVLNWCALEGCRPPTLGLRFTLPALAMPEKYYVGLSQMSFYETRVEAYRAYYKGEKAKFAKWERGTPAPEWW